MKAIVVLAALILVYAVIYLYGLKKSCEKKGGILVTVVFEKPMCLMIGEE